MQTYIILGGGGFAREVFWHIRDSIGPNIDCIFVDDSTPIQSIELDSKNWPVVKDWQFSRLVQKKSCAGFIVGVGSPAGKRILIDKAKHAGIQPAPSIIHPSALIQDKRCHLGFGGVVAPRCTITTNVTIGNYVIINLHSTLGHDSQISDFTTINPGCHISGNVSLGEGVVLGTGTVIREKIAIAGGVVTGAQSCIVKNITIAGTTVVGVPARQLVP